MSRRDVSPEELGLLDKYADKMIPLCSVRGCEKISGHEDEHGPIEFNMEPLR